MASSGMLRHMALVSSSGTSVLTRAIWRNIPEDAILHIKCLTLCITFALSVQLQLVFTLHLIIVNQNIFCRTWSLLGAQFVVLKESAFQL
jgi:hypothetical protein